MEWSKKVDDIYECIRTVQRMADEYENRSYSMRSDAADREQSQAAALRGLSARAMRQMKEL
jgi:hypothetical protein